jgi:hypothetical protein
MGDWNAPPEDSCWKLFHNLEKAHDSRVRFSDINDPSDFSYLWLANCQDKYVSRIDLAVTSIASEGDFKNKVGKAVRSKPIE